MKTRGAKYNSPIPKVGAPMPTVAADADTMVKNLSDELSRLQPPTPTRRSSLTANNCQDSPTPQHRRSKTPKHNESSTAGNINMIFPPNQAAINMEEDDVDGVMEKQPQHKNSAALRMHNNNTAAAADGTEMIVDEVNVDDAVSPTAKDPSLVPSNSIGGTLSSVFRGQPNIGNVKPGGVFSCPQLMFASIEAKFLSDGMNPASLKRKSKAAFEPNEKTPWGNERTMVYRGKVIPIHKRGKFYCGHKTDDGQDCIYNVAFSFFKDQNGFVIQDGKGLDEAKYNTNFCLKHSHSVDNVCIGVDDCFVVSKQDDLTLEEVAFIRTLAEVHCTIPQVKDGLRHRFGKDNKRAYSSSFVANQLSVMKDEIFGKDRHKMKEMTENGAQIIKNGGVWEIDVSDTLTLEGIRYQSNMMRQMAVQYGSYFFTADGTYGLNKYKLTTCPMVTVDCLGQSHCCGVTIGLSENSADVIKGCKSFLLSSVLDECEEVNFNENVDGVVIKNHVIKNSCRGSMYTDDGPFSSPSARAIGKDHGLCTLHERQAIPSATAGIGGDRDQAMRDLNAFIFKYTSVSVLEAKFAEARTKYAHCAATLKLIDSLYDKKEKLCRAFTQAIFSYNHTTTQRGEGFNDIIKGHASLKAKLSDATLIELIDRFDAIIADAFNKSLNSLTKIRQNDERVAPSYTAEVAKSLELSALSVKSCEKVDGSEAQFLITRTNGEIFVVDLKTKVMHRGEIFVIPTCSCGYWHSSLRLCRDIAKALVISSELSRTVTLKDLIVVTNIHPFHLAQFHPMWPQAVRKANRVDYDDLPQIKRILAGGAVNASSSTESESTNNNDNGAGCPDKFYTYKGKKKIPPMNKIRYTQLNEVFKKTADLAVNRGNGETFQHFHARMLQCQKEMRDMITSFTNGVLSIGHQIPLPPHMPASNKAERRKSDTTNNSRLSNSSSNGTKKAAKKKQPKKQPQTCPQCELLVKQANLSVAYNDHSLEQCQRVDLFKQYVLNLKPEAGGKRSEEDGMQGAL